MQLWMMRWKLQIAHCNIAAILLVAMLQDSFDVIHKVFELFERSCHLMRILTDNDFICIGRSMLCLLLALLVNGKSHISWQATLILHIMLPFDEVEEASFDVNMKMEYQEFQSSNYR